MSELNSDENLVDKGESIQTKAEFVEFLKLLLSNYRTYGNKWENDSLDRYLEAMSAWVDDSEGYYDNLGIGVDPNQPSWRVFADILLAARVYE